MNTEIKKLASPFLWAYRTLLSTQFVSGMAKAFLSNWRGTIWWTVANLVGGLMPLWTAMFLRRLYSEGFRFSEFAAHGDFALYSAAFLAPAIYQAASSARRQRSLLQSGTVTLSSIALVFSAIVFTAVNPELTVASHVGNQPPVAPVNHIDSGFLLHVSWGLLAFSFVVALCVFLNDSFQDFPDPDSSDRVDAAFLAGSFSLNKPEIAPGLEIPKDISDGTLIETHEDLARQFAAREGEQQ